MGHGMRPHTPTSRTAATPAAPAVDTNAENVIENVPRSENVTGMFQNSGLIQAELPRKAATKIQEEPIAVPAHNLLDTQRELMELIEAPRVATESEEDSNKSPLVTEMLVSVDVASTGSSSNSSLDAVLWAVECAATCSEALCTQAQRACSRVSVCRGMCVSDICNGNPGGTVDDAVATALRCDSRTNIALNQAADEQAKLEQAAKRFAASVVGSPLAECPSVVSGDEIWNIAPYDSSIPSWTSQVLTNILRDIENARANVTAPTRPTQLISSESRVTDQEQLHGSVHHNHHNV